LHGLLQAIANEMTDQFKTFNIWFTLKYISQSPFVGVVVSKRKINTSFDVQYLNLEKILRHSL
jgi:hypothetical protein